MYRYGNLMPLLCVLFSKGWWDTVLLNKRAMYHSVRGGSRSVASDQLSLCWLNSGGAPCSMNDRIYVHLFELLWGPFWSREYNASRQRIYVNCDAMGVILCLLTWNLFPHDLGYLLKSNAGRREIFVYQFQSVPTDLCWSVKFKHCSCKSPPIRVEVVQTKSNVASVRFHVCQSLLIPVWSMLIHAKSSHVVFQ